LRPPLVAHLKNIFRQPHNIPLPGPSSAAWTARFSGISAGIGAAFQTPSTDHSFKDVRLP
jgi:hypothetical protein